MFSVGQMVYHKSGKRRGKVVECDGDTVYLVMDNGVETDFRSAELTVTPPEGGEPVAAGAGSGADRLSRILTMADITEAHQKVLASIPQRTMQSVAALFERRPKAGRFSALNVAEKLNYIAEVTAVPFRTMKAYSDRPGELSLMMGRGLSVRSGSAAKF